MITDSCVSCRIANVFHGQRPLFIAGGPVDESTNGLSIRETLGVQADASFIELSVAVSFASQVVPAPPVRVLLV